MNLPLLLILFLNLNFESSPAPIKDLAVDKVQHKFTSKGGVYFIYSIKNEGEVAVEGIEYKVKFKLNGRKISFDKSPKTLEPGEKLQYQTSFVEYKTDEDLNYILEIKVKDKVNKNNILEGRI